MPDVKYREMSTRIRISLKGNIKFTRARIFRPWMPPRGICSFLIVTFAIKPIRVIAGLSKRSLPLEHFAKQLLHAFASDDERLASRRRRAIHPPNPSVVLCGTGLQQAVALHPVKNGIQRAGTQSISVPTQLVDHLLTEDRAFRCMMQQVQADQAGEQTSLYQSKSDN